MENNSKYEGLRVVTRKEYYENFRNDVCELEKDLRRVDNMTAVLVVLKRLEELMKCSESDLQLEEIHGHIKDVLQMIGNVKIHDCTRTDLFKLLEVTVERCDEVIAGEIYNDQVNRVRWFFQQCAEHAEELSDIIDFSKLFET